MQHILGGFRAYFNFSWYFALWIVESLACNNLDDMRYKMLVRDGKWQDLQPYQ